MGCSGCTVLPGRGCGGASLVGVGCMRSACNPLGCTLRLPSFLSSHPRVGPDPDLHPRLRMGGSLPLSSPHHTPSPSTSPLPSLPSASCAVGSQRHLGGLVEKGHALLGARE